LGTRETGEWVAKGSEQVEATKYRLHCNGKSEGGIPKKVALADIDSPPIRPSQQCQLDGSAGTTPFRAATTGSESTAGSKSKTKPRVKSRRTRVSLPHKPHLHRHRQRKENPRLRSLRVRAEELFHSVDEILAFDSKHTGLPIKKEVKRKLTSRDEVVSYLHQAHEGRRCETPSALGAGTEEIWSAAARFLIWRNFWSRCCANQVAGYYDPKTKTVNLLDWVPIEQQEPVMAHELTHALQDQAINLSRWMKKGEKDLGEIKKDPTPSDIENDEIDNAREAVVEGQAEGHDAGVRNWRPWGRSIVDSPDLVETMASQMANTGPMTRPSSRDAPIFLRESLTFPYSYGLELRRQTHAERREAEKRSRRCWPSLRTPPGRSCSPKLICPTKKIEPMRVAEFKTRLQGLREVRHRRNRRVRRRCADRTIRREEVVGSNVSGVAGRLLLRGSSQGRCRGAAGD